MAIEKMSSKQKEILTWWCPNSPDCEKEAIICDGAVRSGKTLFMGISFVLWAMCSFSDMKFGLCGKTIVSLRRNVVSVIIPVLSDLGFRCRETVSKNMLTVSFGGRENTFYMFGGKDEGSAALIQGITFAGVLLDEVALMPRSFVEQACARCSVAGSRLWFNCNPESPGHWFYREWILKAGERNALRLHLTMEDNPALSEEIRRRYERMYTGVFYQRFVLGNWVMAEGRVYDFFDDSFVKPVPEGEAESYYISCDYGTVNPTSFGLWGLYGGVWHRIKEYYYDSRRAGVQKTDEEYAADLAAFAGNRNIAAVIVDPSAASFIQVLCRRNFRVIRAVNDVIGGIRYTSDLLKSGRIVICDTCNDAIREFSMYVWDTAAPGDTVVKKHDHAMDEIRYFASTVVRRLGEVPGAIAVERK